MDVPARRHTRESFPAAHHDLCLLAGLQPELSQLWPVVEASKRQADTDVESISTTPDVSRTSMNYIRLPQHEAAEEEARSYARSSVRSRLTSIFSRSSIFSSRVPRRSAPMIELTHSNQAMSFTPVTTQRLTARASYHCGSPSTDVGELARELSFRDRSISASQRTIDVAGSSRLRAQNRRLSDTSAREILRASPRRSDETDLSGSPSFQTPTAHTLPPILPPGFAESELTPAPPRAPNKQLSLRTKLFTGA